MNLIHFSNIESGSIFNKNTSLWALMLIASALNFFKVFTFALLMEPVELGNYLSLLGGALLFSAFVSFGLVESTIKLYPRLWSKGRHFAIVTHIKKIGTSYFLRFFTIFVCALIVIGVFEKNEWFPHVVLFTLVAFFSGLLNISASVVRSSTSKRWLLGFTYSRTVLSFSFALTGAIFFGWKGALFGEMAAALLTVLIAATVYFRTSAKDVVVVAESNHSESQTDTSGRLLYFSLLFSSVIIFADKGLVGLIMGGAVAGTYAIVMTVAQIGQLTVNVIAQRVGPQIIKNHAIHSSMSIWSILALPFFAVLGMVFFSVTIFIAAKYIGMPERIFAIYSISYAAIILAGCIAIVQLFVILEFALLARDNETAILISSAAAVGLFLTLFVVGGDFFGRVEWFLFSLLVARILQIVLLIGFYLQKIRLI